jgi:hypothetical protein
MAKQGTELEKLIIKRGDRISNAITLHPRTGTVATLTIYAPRLDNVDGAYLMVSVDGREFVQFFHRGLVVKVLGDGATDVPLPACKAMRVQTLTDQDEDKVFQALAQLEVD